MSLRRYGVALSLFAFPACSTGPAEIVDLQALELSTSFSPQADTVSAFSGSIEFRNPSNRPATVILRAPCTIILRAYRLDLAATTPAWDQARRPGGCKSFPLEFTIPSRGTRSLAFGPLDAAEILNDSLPVTRYRLTVFISEAGGSFPGEEITLAIAVLKPS
jgi:hypothetical protein